MPVVLGTRHKHANQRALAARLAAKHRYLDALLHVSQNVAIECQLREEAVLLGASPYFFNLNLCILVPGHVEKDRQRFLHLLESDAEDFAIIRHADLVHCVTVAFVQPEAHLSLQVVDPVHGRLVEHQLVLAVAEVRLSLDLFEDFLSLSFILQLRKLGQELNEVFLLLHLI